MAIKLANGDISALYLGSTAVSAAYLGSTSVWSPGGGVATDPDFASVSLLLHMDGTNGSTTFTDSSAANRTATRVGSPVISTAQSKFGGASGLFNGSGDYLSFPDSEAFNFADGDFTIEAWIWLSSHPGSYGGAYYASIVSQDEWGLANEGFAFQVGQSDSSQLSFVVSPADNSARYVVAGTANFALSTWYHVAAVRDGNTMYLYKDGQLINAGGSSVTDTFKNSGATLKVGAADYDSVYKYWFPGHIDDVRITKGVARYPGGTSFTPPGAPFPSSGEPPPVPQQIAGLKAWWDASDATTITESGGSVSQVDDKSGNDYHLTQSTGSSQPSLVAAAQNGLNVLRFDGADDSFDAADFADLATGEAITVICVAKRTGTGSKHTLVSKFDSVSGDPNSEDGWFFRLNSSDKLNFGGTRDSSYTQETSSATVSAAATSVLSFKTTSGSLTSSTALYKNGHIVSSSSTGTVETLDNSTYPVVIGRLDFQGAAYDFWDGDICEIIIYNTALSDTDREAVEDYLMDKWGIPVPQQITGLQAWWDASDASTITESGGSVSQVDDKSGNDYHLTQSTGSSQPSLVAAAQNGLNVLRFDGADDNLQSTLSLNGLAGCTWLAVGKTRSQLGDFVSTYKLSTSGPGLILRAGDSTATYGFTFEARPTQSTGSYYFATRSGSGSDSFVQITGKYDGSALSAYRNGTAGNVDTGPSGNLSQTGNFAIASNSPEIGNAGASFSDIDICEIIIYDSALSDTDRETVENYLMTKWGIT